MPFLLQGRALAICVVGMLLVQAVSCAEESSMPKTEKTMTLIYSSMKEKVTGLLDAQGNWLRAKYEGKRVVVIGTVTDVRLPHRSPSISIEDATARFTLAPGQVVPNAPECHVIELRFDEHAGSGPFVKGEMWEITLTDKGELVLLLPER